MLDYRQWFYPQDYENLLKQNNVRKDLCVKGGNASLPSGVLDDSANFFFSILRFRHGNIVDFTYFHNRQNVIGFKNKIIAYDSLELKDKVCQYWMLQWWQR